MWSFIFFVFLETNVNVYTMYSSMEHCENSTVNILNKLTVTVYWQPQNAKLRASISGTF